MKSMLSRYGKRKVYGAIAGIALLLLVVWFFGFRNRGGGYQFVTVTRGPIEETVSVTGNTTPVKSFDLGFESGGTIGAVNADVGAHVNAGDVLARLDTRDLEAQLAQAKANVDAETAQLRSLQVGAQPADIQASQAAVDKAQQDLSNMYGNVPSTFGDAYAKANDAVRNQIAAFFSNPETNNPQLSFAISDSQTLNDVQFQRVQASGELNKWQSEVSADGSVTDPGALDAVIKSGLSHLNVVKQLLLTASQALVLQTNLSSATVDTYHTALTAGLNEVNTATTNLNTAAQNIASQKILVTQLQAQLELKRAGSTPEAIAAQQAQVEQASANLQAIQVKIAKAALVSPIAGVVSVQNAKVGQIATPGSPLVSIISDSDLEVDANVPETDVGKISLNNPVSMTFDAFPNETFTGKVFYIDPAATILQGVVDYKVKVSFDNRDPRIKSGLTANLDIETQKKDSTLVLPQFAILQNDAGTFVEILQSGKVTDVPVTLGIRDDKGNVEVLSGVTENEQVLNIGLKP